MLRTAQYQPTKSTVLYFVNRDILIQHAIHALTNIVSSVRNGKLYTGNSLISAESRK
jgi:hypothetical protein